MSLSIATASIPGDLRAKLTAIANAGFHGVELFEPDFTGFDGSAPEVQRMASDLGLCINIVQQLDGLEGQTGDLRTHAFDRLERKFDLIQALGCDTLMIGASTHPQAVGERDVVLADLLDVADRAASRGVRAAYMALPWARFVQTETDALDLLQQIDNPHLGLALNSYFCLADGSKPARLRDFPGDRIFHVQLSDAPIMDFDIRRLKRHFGLLPGQGGLNLPGFVRVLAACGYRGPWSLARLSEQGPGGANENVARDGYRALVNLLDEVARAEPGVSFHIPQLPERVYASGFEFIEFAADAQSGKVLTDLLSSMCFRMERKHISKSVELWRQGAVNIVVNTDTDGYAHTAFQNHGPSVCDLGLRVKDAQKTVERAAVLGTPMFSQPVGTGELDIPAIRGVGGSVVHFIDEKSDLHRVWDIEFNPVAKTAAPRPAGLRRIDHVAQTMRHEEMQSWLLYYISTFEMQKSSVVDVVDPSGVVHSQVIESPEGEIRLNLNGAAGPSTFAGAFLKDQVGAGVQHIALLTDDIFETSDHLSQSGFERLEISANYYMDLKATYNLEDAFVEKLQSGNILYTQNNGEYFQIYSKPIFHGFFFEIIQRRGGYQGYGARNASVRLASQLKHMQRAEDAGS